MPKVLLSTLPPALIEAILRPDPLEGVDILIENDEGKLLAAIIPADAYQFFLNKVEEREDEIDSKVVADYDPNAKTLEDFINDIENEQ